MDLRIIFDLLLETQGLFKSTVKIQGKNDRLVAEKPQPVSADVLHRLPQAPQRQH